jgi:phenylacetate-CoA ligase
LDGGLKGIMEANRPYKQETLPRKELEDLIERRISATVKLAYEHVRYWKDKFDSLGLHPKDIRNKGDLLKAYKAGVDLPSGDLIRQYDELTPDYLSGRFAEELWTSGSGGIPKSILYTESDINRSNEQLYFAYDAFGLRPGDKMLSLLAPQPFSSGVLNREGVKYYGLAYLQATPVPIQFLSKTIERFRPSSIFGLPTRIYGLPIEFKSMNVDVRSFNIRKILLGGESVTSERKKKISVEWNADVFDLWASTEGSGMAYECIDHSGMHFVEPRLFLTFVNPETRDEVAGDEYGFDLITTLYEENERPGRILINYSHGDMSKFISGTCNCGRIFKKITPPFREDDVVSLRGAKLYVRDVESLLAKLPDFTGEYEAILTFNDATRSPSLEFRLESLTDISDKDSTHLNENIRVELFKSNPAALSVLHAEDIKVTIVPKSNVKSGLGKPTRLIRKS